MTTSDASMTLIEQLNVLRMLHGNLDRIGASGEALAGDELCGVASSLQFCIREIATAQEGVERLANPF